MKMQTKRKRILKIAKLTLTLLDSMPTAGASLFAPLEFPLLLMDIAHTESI
jgi:hypothetical protein